MAPTSNPMITLDEPLLSLDTTKIHLLLGPDSVAEERRFKLIDFPHKLTQLMLMANGARASSISCALTLRPWCRCQAASTAPCAHASRWPTPKPSAAFFFNLHGPGTDSALVQIFTDEKKIYRQARAERGMADFYYVAPGGYYARVIIDRNGNNRWDTGDYATGQQPEAVYYYPGVLQLRAVGHQPRLGNQRHALIRQKPETIKKQKADPKKTVKNRNAERLRQLGRT